jgi:L-amino acid N-acyltransferase YncA
MASYKVHRANDRDLAVLERLWGEATAPHAGVWAHRRDKWNPGAWVAARAPVVLASDPSGPVAFAAALADQAPLGAPRCAEAIVYVTPAHRRRGAGRAIVTELVAVARAANLWKIIAYALPDDAAGRTLLERADFREVGVLVKHLQLEGGWRDVALYERLVLAARKSMPSISDA